MAWISDRCDGRNNEYELAGFHNFEKSEILIWVMGNRKIAAHSLHLGFACETTAIGVRV